MLLRDTRYEIRDTRYEIRDTRYEINMECKKVVGIKQKRRKKISWYSRGDYTTGANDTFACCRSDIAKLYHLWNKIKEKEFLFDGVTIRSGTYFTYKINDRRL